MKKKGHARYYQKSLHRCIGLTPKANENKNRVCDFLYHLPLKLSHVSQVLFQQLANPHVIQAGWVWDERETVDVWIHGQSLKGVQVKGESGCGGS